MGQHIVYITNFHATGNRSNLIFIEILHQHPQSVSLQLRICIYTEYKSRIGLLDTIIERRGFTAVRFCKQPDLWVVAIDFTHNFEGFIFGSVINKNQFIGWVIEMEQAFDRCQNGHLFIIGRDNNTDLFLWIRYQFRLFLPIFSFLSYGQIGNHDCTEDRQYNR
ncbi:hypothetical protein D3C80_1012750 [compost metagenome]